MTKTRKLTQHDLRINPGSANFKKKLVYALLTQESVQRYRPFTGHRGPLMI